ncbi:MAG: hypothetical protein AB7N80_13755 [Bdellovibrionales bacterium]
MKLQMILAVLAATFLAGCSKCSQQPPTEAPAVEAAPADAGAVEGTSAEALPNSEQMNEELPPPAEGNAE